MTHNRTQFDAGEHAGGVAVCEWPEGVDALPEPERIVPPAPEREVRALGAIIRFAEARERYATHGLDVYLFEHPWARWYCARIITGRALTAAEQVSLHARAPGFHSWADALEWLAPTDPKWACDSVDKQAAHAARWTLPEWFQWASVQIQQHGADPAQVVREQFAFLTFIAGKHDGNRR